MAKKPNIFSRVRLVYRRSTPLTKCVVLTAIVLSTIALLALRGAILETKEKEAQLQNEVATLEKENKSLLDRISELGTVQSIKDLAGKLLGLVDPDTVIFLPEE